MPPPLAPFQPSSSALRVNAFWFLSLCFGLACALTATLVQQWARTYLQAIERRPAPQKKARIRAYLYRGLESFGMTTLVDGIPTLMHISVFLFFAGLVDFLFAINRLVAHTTLIIVSVCAGLYVFITFLPTIRRHSPYRTPLSGICWRILQFLGLLWYVDWSGNRRNIEGSMEQGREMLATEDLPGRDERDQEALSWTMESLTDNIELEPFVEGIPAFLSDPAYRTPSKMQELVVHPDIALMDRIARLLMTCKEPGAMAEDRRRKRAMSCFNAISSLATMSDTLKWITYIFDEELIRKLNTFEADKVLRLYANNTKDIVATKLQSLIASAILTENPRARGSMQSTLTRALPDIICVEEFSPSMPEEVEQETLAKALRILYVMESLVGIIEMIPSLIPAIDYGVSSRLTGVLLSSCKFFYIPQTLIAYKDAGVWDVTDRRRRVLACLRATYAIASHSICHSTTVEVVPHLRKDETADIGLFANCTAARVACHLQSDIVCSMWQLSNVLQGALSTTTSSPLPTYRIPGKHDVVWESNHSLSGHYRKLDALDILHSEDHSGTSDLRRLLRLGVDPDLPWPDAIAVKQWATELKGLIEQLTPDELQLLERLELRTSRGMLLRFKYSLPKMALSRGHMVILIAFLNSIAISLSFSLSGLHFVLDTLKFITRNLSARFASRDGQAALVKSANACIKKLYSSRTVEDTLHSAESHRDIDRLICIRNIIEIVLVILGTVRHPDVLEDAKVVIRGYLEQQPHCDSAINALRKVSHLLSIRRIGRLIVVFSLRKQSHLCS